jgi:hypothetical protein
VTIRSGSYGQGGNGGTDEAESEPCTLHAQRRVSMHQDTRHQRRFVRLSAGSATRAQPSQQSEALAGLWPDKVAQCRQVLRITEQHRASSWGVCGGSGRARISLRISQRMTWRKLTATMTATAATSRDHRRAPATVRALVMPQDLVNCHT